MPFPRDDVLDLAPLYSSLQRQSPITPVRTPAGDVAWLVTGYAEARELFADPRLGRSHPNPEKAARISGAAVLGGPMGDDPEAERENHTAMRRMLAPAFSARRMARLREHVAELVAQKLDDLEACGPGADLHETLSFPLPVLVICELLGVPFADRGEFRVWSEGMSRLDDRAYAEQSLGALHAYIRQLLAGKRTGSSGRGTSTDTGPGEDVLSDLAALVPDGPGADAAMDGLAGLGSALLFAGHETTVSRIDVGTLLLLAHPGTWAALAADPARADNAVEEILRVAVPGGSGLPRYAHTDVEISGVRIGAGDAVLIAASAANRDPARFDDAERFDIDRDAGGHLAFGHGPHFCIGAGLARIELTEVFRALPARFPSMRLARPRSEIGLRSDLLTGGVRELPVTW